MTLVEAALVLSLTGVLLAAFVPTFLAHVRTSKLAEATERLAQLHERAAAYYAGEHVGPDGTPQQRCLPESTAPFPETPSSDPVEVDFLTAPHGAETFRALGLTTPLLVRYSYEVAVAEPGCHARGPGTALTLRARGDLDGDDEPSLLERSAAPSADGRALVPVGPLRIQARTE